VTENDRMDCDRLADADAEIALGIADAQTRAAALGHLERCAACRRRVRRLTDVSEGLPELVPPTEPPVGFESRVLARLQPVRSRAAGSARHRTLVAAAVIVALIVGIAGWAVGRSGGPSPAPSSPQVASGQVVTADLAGSHGTLGQVILVGGRDPWLSMTVDSGTGGGRVQCQAVVGGGHVIDLGTFSVAGAYGYWASGLPSGTSIREIRLVRGSGAVLASAELGPWIS
jgi:hypothetical protein